MRGGVPRASASRSFLRALRPHTRRAHPLHPFHPFHPAGYPMLYSARDYFVSRLEDFGFKASASFDAGSGMSYDITGTSGED
jgi:hypothetical protein